MSQEQPIFGSLFEILEFVLKNKPLTNVKLPCPSCGWTIADISHYARIGCPNCYSHFKQELVPIIARIHKSVKHQGKHPKHQILSLEELKYKLAQSIKEERYEEAGKIKKLIEVWQESRDH